MKILHLEDNRADAELTQHVFAEEWPECAVTIVDNREDFTRQLTGGHDLILSDFNLVNFNGLEALLLAREKAPGTPFIFLSGTIGEERALEALRNGASDYVIKDRPKRLVPAVQRALNDARLARERRAAEEQMLRVQRLENIGMLAAGIAHDFNNVLAPIMMGVPLLRMRHPAESDQKVLASIESSAIRGAGLVKQILGFAAGVTGEAQIVQPKHLLHELVGVMEQTFPKNIRLRDAISGGLWPIKANPTQLHQVVLNLCVNARDAMPSGGTLTLRATNLQLDQLGAATIAHARPGCYLLLEVSDTGTGIPPAILEKIWEPFFTTKEVGRGTGLGLSTVRGIVRDHGGLIDLQTRPGSGTLFRVLLPALPEQADGDYRAIAAAIPRGTGELVLVVDDDANVREVTCASLIQHGYRALAAKDGTEAVALFAPRHLEIRAVVSDLDMPGLDGPTLAAIVRKLNPSVRTILSSASADPSDPRRQAPESGAFLSKPYTAETLLGTLHRLLNSSQGAPVK
jgi:two-component system cell cycle sensor histidine kinase/response regulator CckA